MTVLDRRGIFSLAGRGSNSAPSTKTLEEEVGKEWLVLSKLAEESSLSLCACMSLFSDDCPSLSVCICMPDHRPLPIATGLFIGISGGERAP